MSYKKSIYAVAFLFIFSISASAYDTQGRFGMGISMCGTPVILYSTMNYGITNSIGISPSVGFHQFSVSHSYTTSMYNNDIGTSAKTKITSKQKYRLLLASAMLDLKPMRRERSNFLLRVGPSFWRATAIFEDDDPSIDEMNEDEYNYDESIWNLSVKAGCGIEHFFTDHFSVYAGFISQFRMFGSDSSRDQEDNDNSSDVVNYTGIGNQIAELTFTFYL